MMVLTKFRRSCKEYFDIISTFRYIFVCSLAYLIIQDYTENNNKIYFSHDYSITYLFVYL